MATAEVVEAVTEEVATNLEEVAQATRAVDAKAVSFFAGGLAVGVALGFYLGYRFNREKLRLKAFEESQIEVDQIREDYRRRTAALEKKPLEQIVEERGYDTTSDEVERPLPAPVPLTEVTPHPTLRYHDVGGTASTDDGHADDWDYPTELAQRTQDAPYIIHEDEFREMQGKADGYSSVTYTYYNEDDILTDEDDHPIHNPSEIVGRNNLQFGHGSHSADVVFVRNDRLELDMEISRSPGSYEREVVGLETEDALEHSDRRSERRRHTRRHRLEDESS